MKDTLCIYTRACKLYSEGIIHQIDYELKCEKDASESNATTLVDIVNSNQRLYSLIKKLRGEINDEE